MRLARAHFFVSVLAFLSVFSLFSERAFAAGSITYSKKEIQESNGGWHLMMTIVHGGKPALPHVPMRFTFTPTAYYETFLDDKHGDKPQKRTIPLVGQTPINESVDVNFGDPRGKIFDRTRFDFTITRSHNFAAGEYSVKVTRGDGAVVGTPQTLKLEGDNPVIDRRAISFVSSSGKPKDPPKPPASDTAAAAPAEGTGAAPAAAEGTPAAATSDPAPASSAEAPSETTPDPTAATKVPPGSGSCGCRTVGDVSSGPAGAAALALTLAVVWRAHRRRQPSGRLG